MLLNEDTTVRFGLFLTFVRLSLVSGDLNLTFSVSLCLANSTLTGGVRSVDIGLGDGFGSSLGTNGLDVVGFVSDVRDVDVDEVETDLVQLGVHVVDHLAQEGFTVTVDLFNGQRSNGQTELSKDDFFGHILDLFNR